MNRIRRFVALLLLPLWGVVMVHCGLELDGLFGSPVHVNVAKAAHTPNTGGGADDDPDGCGAIENGHFDSHVSWFAVAQPVQIAEWVWSEISVPDLAPVPTPLRQTSHPPPELASCWSFKRRAALLPRAPASLS